MENSSTAQEENPRWCRFYNPKLVEQNDRKSSSSSVPRTDDYQPYVPKQYPVRERPNLESENLVIYQRKEVLSDKALARYTRLVTQAQKHRRCPGLQFGACPPEGKCLICSLDEHTSWDCPYALEIPTKNAIVTTDAVIVCKVCDTLFSGGLCCKQALGRARLKFCPLCRTFGERCKQQCPWTHQPIDSQRRLSILRQ